MKKKMIFALIAITLTLLFGYGLWLVLQTVMGEAAARVSTLAPLLS